jgi:chitin synthase
MISLNKQKYLSISTLAIINILLSSTYIIYPNNWYAYISILSLGSIINSSSIILILLNKMYKKIDIDYVYRKIPRNYTYVIPCYNESYEELNNSINSLINQDKLNNDILTFIIVCDGKVKGHGNEDTTDNILKKILDINKNPEIVKYTTADNKINTLELYKGIYKTIPYLLIIKNINYGKRDSLTLVRRLCYLYNNYLINNNYSIINNDLLSQKLIKFIIKFFKKIYSNNIINFIIGIDADTIFEYRCTYELIKKIEISNNCKDIYDNENRNIKWNVLACVGFVDINKFNINLYILYQYAEYIYSQCLRRNAQSNITHKVNCLSGCNQLIVICEETCGDKILNKFNYLPKENENIFNHIRSYASEDRNHACLMLSMYPYVQTVQTLSAIAYTNVPTSIKVFISQRRRWSLGAITNDMLLVYLPGINIFERIASLVNIIVYSINPFITISTILFLKVLFTAPTYLMLYLSCIMIIPFTYGLIIPIIIKPMIFRSTIYYYISFIIYIILCIPVSFCIYMYSIFNMNIIKWGKTRSLETINNNEINQTDIILIENNINLDENNINEIDNSLSDNELSDNELLDNELSNYELFNNELLDLTFDSHI